MGKRGWASGSPESRLETNYTTAPIVAAGMRQEMGPRLGIYNGPLVQPPGERRQAPALSLYLLKQETVRLQDYLLMTRLLSIFRDLHLDIESSNWNRVNKRTLVIFMAGTEWD